VARRGHYCTHIGAAIKAIPAPHCFFGLELVGAALIP
jgi:hypothetical protein